VGPGSKVLVNGASGGVGTLAVQIAGALGGQVTSVSSARNIERCLDLGAMEALDYERVDPLESVDTFDVVFDVFGNRSFSKARRSLRRGGVYITTVPSARAFFDQVRTRFSRAARAAVVIVESRTRDLETLGDWVERGLLRPVVDRVFDLEQIADAERYLETRRARGKVVVRL
jgi:NADPH:quinone reductase-like Zn-dependent oxidoreductase